jgi:thiosulfate/3-mercaptopyruvate sulfurtransferase
VVTSLLTPTELADLVARAAVRVLDVQFALMGPPSEDLYAAGHLPGAPHLPLETALAGPPGSGGRHPMPDPDVLQDALRQCGIDDGDAVVVYDQATSLAAARAWWVLRWAGLESVRVLDGGLLAWERAGLPVTTEVPSPATGSVTVRPGSVPLADADGAAHAAGEGRLLDVRAGERYRGESEPIDAVAGHIPGAVNLPMGLMVHEYGTFRSPEEIRDISAEHGIDRTRTVTTSCGSGVTAAQMVLALGEAGIDAVPYIGSWSEWITDPNRPIATGPDATG